MVGGRWGAVRAMSRVARSTLGPREVGAAVHRFNEWLAIKRLSGVEAIREDVSAFDLTAMHPRFELAAAALLDDFGALERLVPSALDARHIGMWDVHTWPMLSEFRETPAYAELLATREPWRSRRRDGAESGTSHPESSGNATNEVH